MAGISVVISATDQATGVIGKVNTGLENLNRRAAAARAPIDRMSASLGRFGRLTGISQMASDVNGLGRQIGTAAMSLGRFAPAFGALTSAASVAGLASLVERWTAFGSRLGFDAQRIGMTASSLQGMQGAARLAGSSAEALTSGMQSLGDNLTNAVAGRSPETVQMLSALGLSFRNSATGGARLAKDVLPEIADKIAAIRNPTQQALVATTLFGAAGENLLPFLRRGAAGIADYNVQATRYGLLNEQGVAAANAMREAQTRLQLAVDGVGYSISERVAPVLVPMLLQFSDWIAAHREDISRFFGDVAQRLREWVDSGGPARLRDQIEQVGKSVQGIVDRVGGWTKAFEIVGGVILLKMLSPITAVIAAVARLTIAITEGLVQGFADAAIAAGLFSQSTMKLPVFRVLAATMGIMDSLSGGISPDKLGPTQRRLLGIPDEQGGAPQTAPTVPGQDTRGWIERNMPTWLGGRPSPTSHVAPGERFSPGVAVPDPSVPGGYRNNNPTNLAYYPGQRDVQGFNGRWGVYRDATAGTAAGVDQMLKDQDRGFNTVASEIQRRSPPGENDTIGMIRDISKWAGMDPSKPYDLRDPDQARRLTSAIIRREQGRSPDPAMVDAAVNRSLGIVPTATAPLSPPVPPVPASAPPGSQGQPGPDGKAIVRLQFQNPPPGMTTTTVAQGGLRVETPTLGLAP